MVLEADVIPWILFRCILADRTKTGKNMDWKLFAQLFVTFVVAALGWFFAHYFSARRDLSNERRKIIVSYLLEAYRRLEAAAHASDQKSKRNQVESAIADIQLFGSPQQVRMAADFARTISSEGGASMDALLLNLRNSLRAELKLEGVDGKIFHLRFHD